MKKKVVVIGGGLGGLAVACRLATRGHIVDVFEKRDIPGGVAAGLDMEGFHFDTGPTVLTMPFILDELFSVMGKKRQDYLHLREVNPLFQVLDLKKNGFIFHQREELLQDEVKHWQPDGGFMLKEYLNVARSMYTFWYPSSHLPLSTIIDALAILPDFFRMKAYQSVASQVSQYFTNTFLRQVFSCYPIFLGGNPFSTPAIYSLIHHVICEWGLWYPEGGMRMLVTALVKCMNEMDVEVHLNEEITEIITHHGQATGVRLADGRMVRADVVICNASPQFAYSRLLQPDKRRHTAEIPFQKFNLGMSAFFLMVGTRQCLPESGLLQHNIVTGPNYEELFKDIFQNKRLPSEMIFYLHMPPDNNPSHKSEEKTTFHVMVPVPNLEADINWAAAGKRYRDQIILFLEENYLPDLRSNIVVEHYLTPEYFLKELNCPLGSPFSFQPQLFQSGWFRPHNRSSIIPNLFFVGSGTHPGTGIPSVLTSAKIVDNMIGG